MSRSLRELDVDVDRVGLAGVWDRVGLAMLNLPVSAAGHKYLIKLNPPEDPHVVENEHFFLDAGRGLSGTSRTRSTAGSTTSTPCRSTRGGSAS